MHISAQSSTSCAFD